VLNIVFVVYVCYAVSVLRHLAVELDKQQLNNNNNNNNYYYYYYYYSIISNVTAAVTSVRILSTTPVLEPQISPKQFYFTLYILTG